MANFELSTFIKFLQTEFCNVKLKNDMFNIFFATFLEVINENAPLKRASRKKKRLKLKPWLTNGLLKSIKTKNKKYKSPIFKRGRVEYGEYKTQPMD